MTSTALPLIQMMLLTTVIGLTMFFAGTKKKRLQWRTGPRERRRRDRH